MGFDSAASTSLIECNQQHENMKFVLIIAIIGFVIVSMTSAGDDGHHFDRVCNYYCMDKGKAAGTSYDTEDGGFACTCIDFVLDPVVVVPEPEEPDLDVHN